MQPATFYIVRHGQTQWNVDELLQGHGDSPLTPKGEEQLQALSKTLASIHFDYVFSSDLLRAQRSAQLLTLERELAINTTHLLRERAYGQYEGQPREVLLNRNKELIAQLSAAERWKFKHAPDVESDEEIMSRLLTFFREVAVTYEGQTILIVSHGGVLRVLLRHLGSPLSNGKINNGAYLHLESDGVEFVLKGTHDITD